MSEPSTGGAADDIIREEHDRCLHCKATRVLHTHADGSHGMSEPDTLCEDDQLAGGAHRWRDVWDVVWERPQPINRR